MRFLSTRGDCEPASLIDALSAGIAPDGGLYVPARLPQFSPQDFEALETPAAVAGRLLSPFFADSELKAHLPAIAEAALDFPLPLADWGDDAPVLLELFHGPTAAFKDVGARFLAGCLSRISGVEESDLTVLVATSGDTGGAVAAAFEGVKGVNVGVLYPQGMVSPRQEHQLTCWNDPIASYRISGTFDDCQRLVKQAFADPQLAGKLRLTSANSISVGRLLPQSVYYAASALATWRRTGESANFIIPTGNLGNALACVWARQMGLPIGKITFATNANRSISQYFETGQWRPRDTVATLASAMDVGNPSNMERLRHLFPAVEALAEDVSAYSVDDEQIRDSIRWTWEHHDRAICPHTATAIQAWRWMREQGDTRDWIVVSTAHPAKFDPVVEPLIGQPVEVPPALAELLERPSQVTDLPAESLALREALLARFRHG